ncbi:MAG: class I SAM-dependent methyltransferase [Cyanobacteria bacterium]|nr:class I SAM-dependent methyltransferase [Cyanobacteriota bacterium]
MKQPSQQSEDSQKIQQQISDNFGEAWTQYAEQKAVNPYTKEQFLDWISPLEAHDFTQKTVLEMGSGLGGFTEYAASFGAKMVVGLEISAAVDASASALLEKNPCLSFVQADLLHPPFRTAQWDLVYSIGVLHHLEIPKNGFHQVAALARKEGGQVFIWVYGRENNELVVYIVDPLRKWMSKLPVAFVRWAVAFPLACILWPLLLLFYGPISSKYLPYFDYFRWLRRYGFGYTHGMITDQLIPPRTHYLRQDTLKDWFDSEGVIIDAITPRNKISWRVLGHKP